LLTALLVLVVGSFLISLLVTQVVRYYALRHSLIDIPNSRSSHSEPTPRGGGLAIVLTWFLALAILLVLERLDPWVGAALLAGGVLVAGVGWVDDRRGVSAGLRASIHLIAAVWAVWCLGGFQSFDFNVTVLPLEMTGNVLAVVGIAWLVNLYNFMDGIDGIAGGEAVSVALVAAGLLAFAGGGGMALAVLSLAAATGGFLVLNWPPAKIFMGDVGSGLLGYAFGVLAIASERAGAVPLAVWMILLGVFIVDATATLISRVVKGERWYQAHRSHAYQRAVQAGYSHRTVTIAVLGLNAVLALAAVAVSMQPTLLPEVLAATAVGLALLWFRVVRLAPRPN
jgi:Fuc2NAc and GlcNAc transferase